MSERTQEVIALVCMTGFFWAPVLVAALMRAYEALEAAL